MTQNDPHVEYDAARNNLDAAAERYRQASTDLASALAELNRAQARAELAFRTLAPKLKSRCDRTDPEGGIPGRS